MSYSMNPNRTMEITLKNLLRHYCLETTILGLKYFYLYPNRFSRLFWTVALALMLMSACRLTQLLYVRYMESPTRTSFEGLTERVDNMPYPSITICSPNQVSMSFMKHFNRTLVDGDMDIDLKETLPKLMSFYFTIADDSSNFTHDMVTFQTLLDKNRYVVSEVMGRMGQTCENFLKLCLFEGKQYQNCKTLFYPVLTPVGMCCTFNNQYYFNDKRNRLNPEFRNITPNFDIRKDKALKVIADIDTDDALGNTLLYAGSVKIMFSNSDEFPFSKQTMFLDTNTESLHIITPIYTVCADDMKVLQPDVRKCYLEEEKSLKYFRKYRLFDCEFECFLKAVEEKCGCVLFYSPEGSSKHFCNLTNISCASKFNFNAINLKLIEKCDCQPDCEYRSYNIDLLSGNLDAVPYLLRPEPWPYGINKTSIKLTFSFFRSLYLIRKQETVVPFSSFISNLGGVFGLCLGCSFISLVEILFYLYIAIYKRKRPQRKVKERKVVRPKHLPYIE